MRRYTPRKPTKNQTKQSFWKRTFWKRSFSGSMLVFRVYSPHQNRTKKSLPFITGTIFTWQLTPFHPIKRPPQLHHVEVISAAHASRVGASSAGNVEKSGHLSWRVCERLTADPIAPTVNKVNGWFNLKRSSSKYHQRLLDQLKAGKHVLQICQQVPDTLCLYVLGRVSITIWPNITNLSIPNSLCRVAEANEFTGLKGQR